MSKILFHDLINQCILQSNNKLKVRNARYVAVSLNRYTARRNNN